MIVQYTEEHGRLYRNIVLHDRGHRRNLADNDMVMKPTKACKRLEYNILVYSMLPTCFGHTYGHPQGGVLQRLYYETF